MQIEGTGTHTAFRRPIELGETICVSTTLQVNFANVLSKNGILPPP